MINASDFRNGVTLEMDNGIWTIVSFLHVKPGKGAAFVRTKLKNVVTGSRHRANVLRPPTSSPRPWSRPRTCSTSTADGDLYYFMDTETYDQLPLNQGARSSRRASPT